MTSLLNFLKVKYEENFIFFFISDLTHSNRHAYSAQQYKNEEYNCVKQKIANCKSIPLKERGEPELTAGGQTELRNQTDTQELFRFRSTETDSGGHAVLS